MKQKLTANSYHLLAVAIILSTFLLGSIPLGSSELVGQQKAQRVLVIAQQTESQTWDPMVGYGSGSDIVTYNIYEGLLSIERLDNGTWIFKPLLATSWTESANHTVWTFNLRQNVLFHDGTKFNSTAVTYWFDRMKGVNKGPAWLFTGTISKVEAVDTYTVRMTLVQPMPSFDFKCIISNVFGGYGMVSPTFVKAHATANDPWAKQYMYDHACGTGPYMLANVTHGVGSVWIKNSNYWGGWSGNHIDRVDFQTLPDPNVQMLKFLTKDVDMYGSTIEQIPNVLSQLPSAQLSIDQEYLSVTYIWMNMGKQGPLQDINVRKAISYAFDYEGIVDYIYAGYARQARGPLPHGIPYWDSNLFQYQTNVTKAKEYMANSSYPNGFTATIAVGPGDWERVGEVFQSDMSQLGITVTLQTYTYSTLWEIMSDPETAPEFSIALWYPDYPTADVYLTPIFGPLATAWQNWSFYENAQVNSLLEQGRYEFNETKRAQIYKQIQQIIVDDAPTVFMYEPYREIFLQSYVSGFKRSPLHAGYSIYNMNVEGKYPAEQPVQQEFPWTTVLLIGAGAAAVLVVVVLLLRRR
jgi:peptide/nickel transport system substrate-binding protein